MPSVFLTKLKKRGKGFVDGTKRRVSNLFGVRDERTNVFQRLYEANPMPIDTAKGLLSAYITDAATFRFEQYPGQKYCIEQCGLFGQNILDGLNQEWLTVGSLREGFENLSFLLNYLYAKDQLAYRDLVSNYIRLLKMLSRVATLAEQAIPMEATSWDYLADFTQTILDDLAASPAQYYTAKMTYFQLGRLLGAGGFGAVFKAWLGSIVCTMKFVPLNALPDIQHSVMDKEVASMVNHPCIVKYHACFACTSAYVTCMEYIRGVDVIKLVNISTRLSPLMVQYISAQLGLALQHMHYKGFIHRDVKPSNMMITNGCRIKLIDFDTVRVCVGKFSKKYMRGFSERTGVEFADANELAGTLPYIAPEGFFCGFGRALDWWAFGVVVYELATGKQPFRTERNWEEQQVVTSACSYEWPHGHSGAIKNLVAMCLQKNVEDRLCSGNYNDLQKHKFFEGMDWRWVEASAVVMEFDPVASVKNDTLTFESVEAESPPPSPKATAQSKKLFPISHFVDSPSQYSIFTYSSPGFHRVCDIIYVEGVPTENDIFEPPELVDGDDYNVPYTLPTCEMPYAQDGCAASRRASMTGAAVSMLKSGPDASSISKQTEMSPLSTIQKRSSKTATFGPDLSSISKPTPEISPLSKIQKKSFKKAGSKKAKTRKPRSKNQMTKKSKF